jgi:acetolactate synthase-1/2/3 large subunit
MLGVYDSVVLAGSVEPVTFFGYEGIDSFLLTKNQEKASISTDAQNVFEALEYLVSLLQGRGTARYDEAIPGKVTRPGVPSGALTPEKACLTLAALQPEGAIIVDEGLTTSLAYYPLTADLPRHTLMTIVGGAIGFGMPSAAGAALACPDRPVINLQADGSALYTVQALWTQAREGSNITTLICSNRTYRIVRREMERAGIASPGPASQALTDLGRPPIDWAKLALGFGVPAATVTTGETLAHELAKALHEPGPHLIEMIF